MFTDEEKEWLKAINIAQSNKLLRIGFLQLFDLFHPKSMLIVDGGKQRYRSPPRDVMVKLGQAMSKVLQNRTCFVIVLNLWLHVLPSYADLIHICVHAYVGWTEPIMVKSIIHRVQKVFAEERRRVSGSRTIKRKAPKAPPGDMSGGTKESLAKDLKALEELAKAQECAQPDQADPAFALIERTWARRHKSIRNLPRSTLESYFEEFPFMSSWRMVCSCMTYASVYSFLSYMQLHICIA